MVASYEIHEPMQQVSVECWTLFLNLHFILSYLSNAYAFLPITSNAIYTKTFPNPSKFPKCSPILLEISILL